MGEMASEDAFSDVVRAAHERPPSFDTKIPRLAAPDTLANTVLSTANAGETAIARTVVPLIPVLTACHVWPPSADLNMPPPLVPAKRVRSVAKAGDSATRPTLAGPLS